jgi:hypothetical protein
MTCGSDARAAPVVAKAIVPSARTNACSASAPATPTFCSMSFDQGRIADHLVSGPVGELPPRTQHHDAIAKVHDEPQHVLDHVRDAAFGTDAARTCVELADPIDQKTRGPLVEQQHLRFPDECADDLDDPLLTERRLAAVALAELRHPTKWSVAYSGASLAACLSTPKEAPKPRPSVRRQAFRAIRS